MQIVISLPQLYNSLSLSGGFTPCRHLRPSSGREILIRSGDDDYLMNETVGGSLPPTHDALLFSLGGTGSSINMPSRTNTVGPTKAFDYPVMGHWGVKLLRYEADSNRRPVGPQSTTLTTRPRLPQLHNTVVWFCR